MENKEMMSKTLADDALEAVSGGAGKGKTPAAKFNIGDWVCYVENTQIVAQVTRRTYEENGGYWKYGVKFNGEGQELFWISENFMKKISKPL